MTSSNDIFYKKYLTYKLKYLQLKKILDNSNIQKGGGDKIDVILFKANWCGHCKNFIPVWNTLQKQFSNKFNFVTYDADENQDKVKEWKIDGFPSIFLKQNNKGMQYDGPRDLDSMVDALNSLLN